MRSLNESHNGNKDEDVDEVCVSGCLCVFKLCNIYRDFWTLLWMKVNLLVR